MIDLPVKRVNSEAVGINPKFHLAGDFEIAVSYELLDVSPPPKGLGSGIKLWVQFDSSPEEAATLTHVVQPDGEPCIYAILGKKGSPQKIVGRPAPSKKGVLKLQRVGNNMIYLKGSTLEDCLEFFRTEISPGDVPMHAFPPIRTAPIPKSESVFPASPSPDQNCRAPRHRQPGQTPRGTSLALPPS